MTIVSIKNNKYQIIISNLLGFLSYYQFRNLNISILIILLSSYLLRKINIDKIINK